MLESSSPPQHCCQVVIPHPRQGAHNFPRSPLQPWARGNLRKPTSTTWEVKGSDKVVSAPTSLGGVKGQRHRIFLPPHPPPPPSQHTDTHTHRVPSFWAWSYSARLPPTPRKLRELHHRLHTAPEYAQPSRHSSGSFQQGLHRLEPRQGLRAEAVRAPAQTH